MFYVMIGALLWGLDGIVRRGLFNLQPSIVVFWEHVLGAVVLTPFVIKNLRELKKLNRKEWLAVFAVCLFSGALGTIFYTAALGKVNYIQFSVVVLLQQLQPIWAISTAYLVLKEKIKKGFVPWAILAIASSYLVTFKDLKVNLHTGQGTIIAAVFALLAGMMWAMSTSFSKIFLKRISSKLATYLRFVISPIFAYLVILLSGKTDEILKLSISNWKSLFVIVLSTGLVAQLIYYFGLKKVQAKKSAIYELTFPTTAIFVDYFYFKNTLSATQLLGAFLVMLSIYKIAKLKNG